MRITDIRVRSLRTTLPAPMRSRGAEGFTVHYHTGSEFQELAVVELREESGHTGITLLPGDRGTVVQMLEQIARPVLAAAGEGSLSHLRASLMRAAAQTRLSAMWQTRLLSALEGALWDLQGKLLRWPIYQLLGGSRRAPALAGTDPVGEGVPVYAGGGGALYFDAREILIGEARELVAWGFRAMKLKIGRGPEEDIALARAIRDAIGPHIRLLVDANRAYDLDSAMRVLPELAALGVYWFEEPLPVQEAEGYRRLRQAAAPVLIAGGEHCTSIADARRVLEEGMVDVLQADMAVNGLMRWVTMAEMAREAGVRAAPHMTNSALGIALSLHLQHAIANGAPQEFETWPNPFVQAIFTEPWQIRDGCGVLPEAPGLGYTINEATVAQYLVPEQERLA